MQALGKTLRSLGQSLDKVGVALEGRLTYTERLVPSTRLVANAGNKPVLAEGAFVAPNASVVGEVSIGKGSSVWYGATVRGDVNHITIGDNTNVQDQAVIHAAKIANDFPTVIGNNVTIGPSAVIHACKISNQCIIGTGAQVLDGAEVGENSIITAGSIVTMGKKVPAGQLWSGIPARPVRDLTSDEIEFIKQCSLDYVQLSEVHAGETAKTFAQIELEKENRKIMDTVGELGFQQKPEERPDTGLFFKY
ncbi:hypothetical protein SDRG_06605 [Saprolegnia diclina VS20]|uniref:Uncharacterized protein n=2 Tax=Saprolegnia TaxID=4769 RepID=T0QPT8_SAPDV|nr:hypothetical protein SDRG_06605 [Saprolegnia diclina VS20]EQC35855.1 hypothetical protein SDRG_06605 [Saprolegnia diclina VS20]|eukprot:XP_008610617.1 hypothetical protein SDRG_06605 [Saprolegnia diclina VS20]